jgi:hypothetical protein
MRGARKFGKESQRTFGVYAFSDDARDYLRCHVIIGFARPVHDFDVVGYVVGYVVVAVDVDVAGGGGCAR